MPSDSNGDAVILGGSTVNVIGTTWTIAQSLQVGDTAPGTLIVGAGGTVASGNADELGTVAIVSGDIEVAGTGAVLRISEYGSIVLGETAPASLDIGAGGELYAGTLMVGPAGMVSLTAQTAASQIVFGIDNAGTVNLGALLYGFPGITNTGTIISSGLDSGFSARGRMTNDGTIIATKGTTTLGTLTTLGASSLLEVDEASDLILQGGGEIGAIAFLTGDGALTLSDSDTGTIEGFRPGDIIDVLGATSGTVFADQVTFYAGSIETGVLTFSGAPAGLVVTMPTGEIQITQAASPSPTSADVAVDPIAALGTFFLAGSLSDVISTGAGDTNYVFLGAGQDTVYSAGTDTLVGGSGAATVFAMSQALMFATGSLDFINGAASSELVLGGPGSVQGGSGSITVFGGSGALYVAGGLTGGNVLVAGSGNATLIGGAQAGTPVDLFVGGAVGTDDSITTTGPSEVFGGAANVTVTAAAGGLTAIAGSGDMQVSLAGGNNIFYGGTGPAEVLDTTGQDTIVGGTGYVDVLAAKSEDELIVGPGEMSFQEYWGPIVELYNGQAGGTLYIDVPAAYAGNTQIYLNGYGPNEEANALASQTFTEVPVNPSDAAFGWNTSLKFSDGTVINIENVNTVGINLFP